MSIKKQSYKVTREKELDDTFESIIDHTWTNAQIDLTDQGDEADDIGMDSINEEE